MAEASQLVSNFIRSLETHPNGEAIIGIVELILANDSGVIDPTYITSLKELSNNNVSLLIDFWLLRGTILKEEGRDPEAFQLFFEATQWCPDDVRIWLRIADFFKHHDDLFQAFFFLIEAQKHLGSPSSVTDELNHLMQQLEVSLAIPPGYKTITMEKNEEYEESLSLSSSPKECFTIPPDAASMWDLALECFEEGTKGDNLIYLNAFIHYAHSTVREVLGLDGNFKAGLDRKIAQFGLFDFKPFFNRLNSLRNAVIHDNYLLSKEEAHNIHTQVTDFLSFMQTQRI